ncbi:WbqC family protein [Flavihumibacter fluvii]|uniref:WbqC family protein n=1 Tax=Flavihumibacter fluvii TaxID=2838157 RepID=UPI001BDE0E09|nr:WbqC family protein [Flavihumibacter fluvii]ULQ54399.1 WbqC family protein [Flavihumibacter fluvii]
MNGRNEYLLIDLQYFANVNWYKKAGQYKYIIINESERHVKMSFRNRLWVAGADGLLSLSIPVVGSRNEKQLYKDLRIAPGNWAISHFRTIESCYNRSPWFEHYRDELAALYATPFTFLWDWNLACHNWLIGQIPSPTLYYLPGNAPREIFNWLEMDCRNFFRPGNKAEWLQGEPVKYTQVFEDRVGFVPGLSILDLLFCEGPAAGKWLI